MNTETQNHSRFKIMKLYPVITSNTLKQEINYRKLSYQITNDHIKQAFILDRKTGVKSIGFAFRNVSNGHIVDIPNPAKHTSFTTTIGKSNYSFIAGQSSSRVEIFANYWDFLAWQTMNGDMQSRFDSYVLNSFAHIPTVISELEDHKRQLQSVMDFLPNIPEGLAARQSIYEGVEYLNIPYGAQNYIYQYHKGLSDYWMNDPDARQYWPMKPKQMP